LKHATTKPPHVLIVDDHVEMARVIADDLSEAGYQTTAIASGKLAIALLARENFDAIVTDLRIPDADGLQLLAASRKQSPERPVIIMTGFGAVDSAVESIRQGAYHYLTKPFETDELLIFLDRALEDRKLRRETRALKTTLRQRFATPSLVGRSKAMHAVFDVLGRVADSSVPVLLTGETGTGKGVIARALHAEGKRAAGAFVAVNCSAIPETLLESELFGHKKGAFTGATHDRPGLFVEASGGTIFLDEIGDMPLALQAKLLHVLESGTVRPVGSEKELALDMRVVAATNKELRKAVADGKFREDLLYRLDVVSIEVPPLRHRREDIPPLLEHFLTQAKARHPESPVTSFAVDAVERLNAYGWPGNVRELEHLTERLVVLGRRAEIRAADLPPLRIHHADSATLRFGGEVLPAREIQRRYATWALARLNGHKSRTAEALGVDIKTLAKLLSGDD
jgi:two-component system response regulator HydG